MHSLYLVPSTARSAVKSTRGEALSEVKSLRWWKGGEGVV